VYVVRDLSKSRSLSAMLKSNYGVILVTTTLHFMGRQLGAPMLSRYAEVLGARPEQIGLLYLASASSYSISQPLGGYFADRYGRKKIIVALTTAHAIAYLMYVMATDWRHLLVALATIGFICMYFPALSAITADSIPPEMRGTCYALLRLTPRLAGMASLAISSYLIAKYGLEWGIRIGYIIAFSLMLVNASIRGFLLKETYEGRKDLRLSDMIVGGVKGVKKLGWTMFWLVICASFISLAVGLKGAYYVLYAVHIVGVKDHEWPLIVLLGTSLSLLMSMISGRVADKLGRVNAILMACAPYYIGLSLFLLSRSSPMVAIGYSLVVSSIAMVDPCFSALEADLTPKGMRGEVMAMMNLAWFLPTAVGALIGGHLYSREPHLPFIIGGLSMGLAFIFTGLFIREPLRREE